jgi:hypothetical protein
LSSDRHFERRLTVKQQRVQRTAALVCLVGSALGVLLLLGGLGWSLFGDAHLVYSTEQAEEWEKANAAWHAASIGHVHGHSSAGKVTKSDATLAAARERFERADAELQAARFMKYRLGPLLSMVGLAVAGAFGVGYLLLARGGAA